MNSKLQTVGAVLLLLFDLLVYITADVTLQQRKSYNNLITGCSNFV